MQAIVKLVALVEDALCEVTARVLDHPGTDAFGFCSFPLLDLTHCLVRHRRGERWNGRVMRLLAKVGGFCICGGRRRNP